MIYHALLSKNDTFAFGEQVLEHPPKFTYLFMTGGHLPAFWHPVVPVVDFCCSRNHSGKGNFFFHLFSYCKVGRQKYS